MISCLWSSSSHGVAVRAAPSRSHDWLLFLLTYLDSQQDAERQDDPQVRSWEALKSWLNYLSGNAVMPPHLAHLCLMEMSYEGV